MKSQTKTPQVSKVPPATPVHCSNGAIRRATRRLGQLFDDVLAPSGLRATQHGLLAEISHANLATMKQLADHLVMDLSALGHTLKPLIRDGFVVLATDAKDRRCKRIQLTPLGETKLAESAALWRLAQQRFETAFGKREAAELRQTLDLLGSKDFDVAFTTATKVKRTRGA